MFEPVGYCTIKKDADCSKAGIMGSVEDWQGQDVRVIEFSDHSQSALVVSRCGTKMAIFDYKDISRKFKCGFFGDVLIPPDLNPVEQMAYYLKVKMRKGGYTNLIREMIVQASLMKGKFYDTFLFSKKQTT